MFRYPSFGYQYCVFWNIQYIMEHKDTYLGNSCFTPNTAVLDASLEDVMLNWFGIPNVTVGSGFVSDTGSLPLNIVTCN